MTISEVKEALSSAAKADSAYRTAKARRIALESTLQCVKSVSYETDGSKKEHCGNSIEEAYSLLADYKSEEYSCCTKMVKCRQKVDMLITSCRQLTAKERDVLKHKYTAMQTWEKVAADIGCSVRHATRLHGLALKKISDMSLNVHTGL